MYVRYDSLNRHEPLTLILCNPGSVHSSVSGTLTNVVGILTDTTDEELCLNFNQLSELNFRLTRVRRTNREEDNHICQLYQSVQNRRLIFAVGIGYFMITDVKEALDENGRYKDIRAESIEVELQNHAIPFIADGTYQFSSGAGGVVARAGIIENLMERLPLWTVGTVDESVTSKYRTFKEVDTSLDILSFMLNNMQDAFECVFVFDTINRVINVYDQNNYVRPTDIHITQHDLVNSLEISEDSSKLFTALNVFGEEGVSIAAINPLGGNVIYNFNYYLTWMSNSLGVKVAAWQQAVSAATVEYQGQTKSYYEANLEYYTKLEQAFNLQAELNRIEILMTMYQRCRDNIVAEGNTSSVESYNKVIAENGGTPIDISDEIEAILAAIDELIASCQAEYDANAEQLNALNTELSEMRGAIEVTHDSLAMQNYFTPEEYVELSSYIFEGEYIDDYVTFTDIMSYTEKFEQMKVLYDRAELSLGKVSQPTQEFSIDVSNFIFAKEFENWSEQLETGCLINVVLDETATAQERTDAIAQLFLSNITVNYDDETLSLTFGNRLNKFDPKSLFDNMLGKISKSANALSYVQDALYPITHGELNNMQEALSASRTLTMNAALASTGEEVVIDGSGYTGKKKLESGEYDPHQVKIVGKAMVFTDDGWQSCKIAIGEIVLGDNQSVYGVNAQAIIGDIILGNNLRILDNNGNDAFSVVDGKIEAIINDYDGQFAALTETIDGLSIQIGQIEQEGVTEVTTVTGYTFNADGLHIYKSGEEIKNKIDNTGMYVIRTSGTETCPIGGGACIPDEAVLIANSAGVEALNLLARQYLIIGRNSRFENYTEAGADASASPTRTACFFVGQ